ncbi:MAG: helix-turn-helix domain-containing protein [Anaerolineales bacterium]|nr:helix-turn-helix domain-containing protein [Anaerolineales bacterium]
MTEEWLSLSGAADLLGVHQSTVRNWANKGIIPVHKTRGGHRRFRRSEIELWLQSQRLSSPEDKSRLLNNSIRRLRIQISEGKLEKENWYQRLEEDARDQYRRTSRSLIQGLTAELAQDRDQARTEARAVGLQYASLGNRYHLTEVEALHAFLFFRTALLDSALTVFEESAVRSPEAWGDMIRRINRFTDRVMVALLENYAFRNRNHR